MESATRFSTQQEAAAYIGVSRTIFWRLFKSGQLEGTYYKVWDKYIWLKERLDKWMENGGSLQYQK